MDYFTLTATWQPSASSGHITGTVELQMLVENNGVLAIPDDDLIVTPTPITAAVLNNVMVPVQLVANTTDLGIDGNLYYTATPKDFVYINGDVSEALTLEPVTFAAPTTTTTLDLSTVTPAAGVSAVQLASVTSAGITDATTLGRELLTAASQSAAQTALGVDLDAVTGIIKGTGSGIAAAVSGTDYAPATTGTGILKASSGGFANAVAGTDYVVPGGALGTPSSGTLTNCTFPSSIATLTGAQTFTNKTLTSPAITGGTLDNVTIGATTAAPSITSTTLTVPAINVDLSGSTKQPWLNQDTTFYGSLTGGGYFNQLANNDQVVGDTNYIWNLQSILNVHANSVGLRGSIYGHCSVIATGTNTATEAQYVGVFGKGDINVGLGGTAPTISGSIGSVWGGWFYGSATAGTNLASVYGAEIDVNVHGTTTTYSKIGLAIVLADADSVAGSVYDAALVFGSDASASPGWKNGILLGRSQTGYWPFSSTSTIIAADPAFSAVACGVGIDFSNIAFTGPAFKTGAAPIAMAEMSATPSGISGDGQIYVASDGSLHFLSPGGTDTQLAPA